MDETLSPRESFQVEEYRALRKEIEIYIAEIRLQERNVVIALGVIWVWLLRNNQVMKGHWDWLAWFIPVIVSGAAVIRSWALGKHMNTISAYIKSLEQSFGVDGWEKYLAAERPRRERNRRLADALLTYLLLALSLAGLFFHSMFVK